MSTAALVRLDGIERVNRLMSRLTGVADRADMLDRAAAMVESQTRARIQAGGPDPEGHAWATLSPDYAHWKDQRSSGTILNLFGPLRDSLSYAVNLNAREAYVGSNLEYAAIQQFGGTDAMAPGPAGIPARPYLGISRENQSDIEADLAAWADDLLENLQ